MAELPHHCLKRSNNVSQRAVTGRRSANGSIKLLICYLALITYISRRQGRWRPGRPFLFPDPPDLSKVTIQEVTSKAPRWAGFHTYPEVLSPVIFRALGCYRTTVPSPGPKREPPGVPAEDPSKKNGQEERDAALMASTGQPSRGKVVEPW